MMKKFSRFVVALLTVLLGNKVGVAGGSAALVAALEERIPQVMEEHQVPGLSMALIRDNRIVWRGSFGVRVAGESVAVNTETVLNGSHNSPWTNG
jgi:CubicO group peptidase (beta-lactamase class C family)